MIVTPNRNKVLILVIVFLLLANIGMAVLMFAGKTKGISKDRRNQMKEYLEKDLGFSESQLKSYDSIHNTYEQSLDSHMEELRNKRKERFRLLTSEDFSDSAIAKASRLMADQQTAGEERMLRHLRNIRNIGSAEQRSKFDSTFFQKMARKKKSKRWLFREHLIQSFN